MLTTEKRFGSAEVVVIGFAIAAHVQHEHIQHRPVAELAINPPAAIGALQTHGCIFEPGLAGATDQAVDIFALVALIQLLAR